MIKLFKTLRKQSIERAKLRQYVLYALIENVNFSTGEIRDPDQLYAFRMENLLFAFINITEEKAAAYRRALELTAELVSLIQRELD